MGALGPLVPKPSRSGVQSRETEYEPTHSRSPFRQDLAVNGRAGIPRQPGRPAGADEFHVKEDPIADLQATSFRYPVYCGRASVLFYASDGPSRISWMLTAASCCVTGPAYNL